MNWDKFKDHVCYLCQIGCAVTSRSLTRAVAGSNILFYKTFVTNLLNSLKTFRENSIVYTRPQGAIKWIQCPGSILVSFHKMRWPHVESAGICPRGRCMWKGTTFYPRLITAFCCRCCTGKKLTRPTTVITIHSTNTSSSRPSISTSPTSWTSLQSAQRNVTKQRNVTDATK